MGSFCIFVFLYPYMPAFRYSSFLFSFNPQMNPGTYGPVFLLFSFGRDFSPAPLCVYTNIIRTSSLIFSFQNKYSGVGF
jgi:hypothetical protein